MSNTNVNQNAIQVIFPSDMELRKVRKKKRKSPSVNKKKALIKELKELLQAYDQEIELAKEKKVALPSELGQLPKDIKEMKTVKQLELLIDEIKSKILKIQELIRNGSVEDRDGRNTIIESITIYFDDTVNVKANDRIKENSQYYEITGVYTARNAKSENCYTVISCLYRE